MADLVAPAPATTAMPVPVRVISLRRSEARRAEFLRQNDGLTFEFVDAVDGADLSDDALRSHPAFRPPLPFPSKGAYGCALSHLTLWEMAIESRRALTVAEDDVIFRSDFVAESERLLASMPADWDLIVWGWNFDSILSVDPMPGVAPIVMVSNQDALRTHADTFRQMTAPVCALKLDKCFGTPAYTISPAGAERFRFRCFPIENHPVYFPLLNKRIATTGIDIAMNRFYASTRSFVAFPPLAITKNERTGSTVQPPQ